MVDFPFDIVGFDLDGTLLDTLEDLAAAVNHVLAAAGRPLLTLADVRPMIGGGGERMLAMGLEATGGYEPEELRQLFELLLEYYEAHIAVATRPFPGALAAIDALKALGVKVAIVTNKRERLAETLLTELGLRDRFDALIGGDTMDRIMGGKGFAKPHRAPIDEMVKRCRIAGGGRAAFVGDSIFDIMAARNAGIPSIAASFGFLLGPVEDLGADAVIDSFDELLPVLRRLGASATG